MLIFISGLFVGAFSMLFTLSLMMAAKRADEKSEHFFKNSAF